jgi:hypothetical protein
VREVVAPAWARSGLLGGFPSVLCPMVCIALSFMDPLDYSLNHIFVECPDYDTLQAECGGDLDF